ncbi:MAG: sugar isomerase [Bryobacteraceae bacterium]|nr:sugar isomerase [Bryobacteraceae bacterium]
MADPAPVSRERKALVVQPVLIYQIYKRREQTSWRPWGGLFTETEVNEEKQRIGRELSAMAKTAGFPVEILPLKTVTSLAEAKTQGQGQHDVLLMYPATGSSQWLDTLAAGQNWTVVFVRHRSGPVYEYYEIISPRFLRKTVDEWGEAKISTADVVVDSMDEVAVRMRALSAVKNTMGRKVVCIGGAAGWGRGGRQAPERAKEIWKLELPEVTYPDLKAKLIKAKSEAALNRAAKLQAADYLKQKDVKLETTREAVENAFVLRDVFRNIMAEHGTDSITVNHCMGAIMPISETTACMTLSLLNDEGALAFCESDFAVIPSGILLNAISGIPVFLNDPTYPHDQIITLAHCTAPRKMDGKHMEPVRILTHFESDYGAAPKVAMKIGQKLTNIIPDFNGKRWVGFTGALEGNPFLPICRSQIDVAYKCATEKMAEEMRGFHWMTGYGEWSRELAYALRKAGIEWVNLDKS